MMAKITTNLQLVKPDISENVSPAMFNQNFDKIDEEVNALKTDYVVAQGQQGIWTYRRWASGIAECWGSQPITFDARGTRYYSVPSIALPLDFSSLNYKNISVTYVSGDKLLFATSGGFDKWSLVETGGVTLMADYPFTSKQSGYINYDFRGRWKE